MFELFNPLKRSSLIVLFASATVTGLPQRPPDKIPATHAIIGFWNVENLYDTVDDPLKDDDEFTPSGSLAWTSERYRHKIRNLSETLAAIAVETPGAEILMVGLCEIENISVLHDLVSSRALKKFGLRAVLEEGGDARGVDPGFIYNPASFSLTGVVSYSFSLPTDSSHRTRDILVISGLLYGDPVSVLVNHWPSRRGGEAASRPNRMAAAAKARSICDSIRAGSPRNRIVVMGDFNDDPPDASVKRVLGGTHEREAGERQLFNPMEALYREGIGTLAWRDTWNLFDQVLLGAGWNPGARPGLQFQEARVFNKKFLSADHGNYKSYPFRTYSAGSYTGGYSDHYPVYLLFKKTNSAD
jgi:hypothetical protein